MDNSLLTALFDSASSSLTPRPTTYHKGRYEAPIGEEEKRKTAEFDQTGSQGGDQPDVLIDDEVDPADFIDPEEFGCRRKFESFHS